MTAIRSAALYAVTTIAARGLSFALLPLMTHRLEPAAYGTLELFGTIADIGTLLVSCGLAEALYRHWAAAADADARRAVAASALGLATVISGLALAVGAIASVVLALSGSADDIPLLFALTAATIAIEGTIQVPLAWLRLAERPLAFAVLCVGRTGLQGLLIVGALYGELGVAGVLGAGTVSGLLLALALGVVQARATGLALDGAPIRAMLQYGGPLAFGGVALFVLGSFDRWWLVAVAGTAAIADYALAAKLALAVPMLLQPFAMWWHPRRLSVLRDPDGHMRSARIVATGVTGAVLAAVAVGTVGPLAITVLTPPSYHGAVQWLPWLVAAAAFQQAADLMNVGCFAGRSGRLPATINVAAAVACLVGYATLIPAFGVFGAVLTTVGAQALRWSLFLAASQHRVFLPYPMVRLGLIMTLAATTLAIASMSATGGLFDMTIAAAVACALTIGGAFAMRLITWPRTLAA